MKKMISVLLAAAMTVSALSVTAFAEEEYEDAYTKPVYALGNDISLYEPGDVNMDGSIDSKDASAILCEFNRYVILEMPHVLQDDQLSLADVWKDGNNRADPKDANIILYYLNCQLLEVEGTVGIGMEEFIDLYTRTSGFKTVLEI